MKILIAYSSKTNNTRKVAQAIFNILNLNYDVDFVNIKKIKNKLTKNYNLYILGAWTDKTNASKDMLNFIKNQNLENKIIAPFLTCGVPREHYHANDSITNFKNVLLEKKAIIAGDFICQGKIDPKILIVFKILSWKDPNFIHKVTPDLKEMVKQSRTHPTTTDLNDAQKWITDIVKSLNKNTL